MRKVLKKIKNTLTLQRYTESETEALDSIRMSVQYSLIQKGNLRYSRQKATQYYELFGKNGTYNCA